MILTDNDTLGSGALTISCSFPAKRWWEAVTSTGGAHGEESAIYRQLGVGRLPHGVVLCGDGGGEFVEG